MWGFKSSPREISHEPTENRRTLANRFTRGADVVPAARQEEAGGWLQAGYEVGAPARWEEVWSHPTASLPSHLPLCAISGQLKEEKRCKDRCRKTSLEAICDGLERNLWTSVTLWHVLSVCLRALMTNHRPVDWGWGRCRKCQHSYPTSYLSCGRKAFKTEGRKRDN